MNPYLSEIIHIFPTVRVYIKDYSILCASLPQTIYIFL